MMKKTFSLLLAVVLSALVLCSCGSKPAESAEHTTAKQEVTETVAEDGVKL